MTTAAILASFGNGERVIVEAAAGLSTERIKIYKKHRVGLFFVFCGQTT